MSATTLPPSISLFDNEIANRYPDPDLDYAYIDRTARFVASCLGDDASAEVAFQPGDGTRYNLIFVAPAGLATALPRHYWERHAITGIKMVGADSDDPARVYYKPDATLLVWVEQGAYALNLDNDVTADYIAQKFNTTIVSGCTLAILLRAINYYIRERQL